MDKQVFSCLHEWVGIFLLLSYFFCALFLSLVCGGFCLCVCVFSGVYVCPPSLMASFPVLVGMCKDSQLCPVHWHSSLSGNSPLHSENSFTIWHYIWLLLSLTCIHITLHVGACVFTHRSWCRANSSVLWLKCSLTVWGGLNGAV